eukprot:11431106-Alexandrium_andersonii.AAC.2
MYFNASWLSAAFTFGINFVHDHDAMNTEMHCPTCVHPSAGGRQAKQGKRAGTPMCACDSCDQKHASVPRDTRAGSVAE